MVLIDAVYINTSGGKVLLESLIYAIISRNIQNNFFFLVDSRLSTTSLIDVPEKNLQVVEASESSRKKFYRNFPHDFSSTLCFANVPPPVVLQSTKVLIFFHNALLLNSFGTNYPVRTSLLFFLKRQYIKFKNRPHYQWIVQTRGIKSLLSAKVEVEENMIKILPFYNADGFSSINTRLKLNDFRFLYVAGGEEQKNHLRLLAAWEDLNLKKNMMLELNLTVSDRYPTVLKAIKSCQEKGVLVKNHGFCNKKELTALYSTCNYLVFPSLSESLGLPLIEAAIAGCDIISSDLPYVYDVITPLATFNPLEISSISNTIALVVHQGNHEQGNRTVLRVHNEVNNLINLIQ